MKKVGVVGVFDGHGGEEASEMASKLFIDYFLLHSIFNSYKTILSFNKEDDDNGSGDDDESIIQMKKVLREALLRTILEIDLTFSKVSFVHLFVSLYLLGFVWMDLGSRISESIKEKKNRIKFKKIRTK